MNKSFATTFVCCFVLSGAVFGQEPAGDSGAATYTADVPAVDSIEPNWAPLGKEAEVVIRGRAFSTESVPQVLIGGKPAPWVNVVSDSEIRTMIPRKDRLGWESIQVINPDNQSIPVEQGFHHGPIPSGWLDRTGMRLGSFADRFAMGGSTMYAILLLSVVGLAWFIHCLFYLRPARLMDESSSRQILALLSNGDFGEAQKACERDKSLFARVVLAGVRRSGESPQKITEAIEAAGSRESAHLFQKVSYLSNIGVISPMLGLFGTVLGMVMVFDEFANQDGPHQVLLAAGISKALYTTVFGLTVGIPAMCAYYFLRGKVMRLVTDLEEQAEEVTRSIARRS